MGKTVKAATGAVKAIGKGDAKSFARNAMIFTNPITGEMEANALGLKEKKASGGGGGAAGPSDDPYQRKADEYERLAQESRIKNLQSQDKFTESLEQQAYGKGPSLASAQLKAAQNRNLAQTLSAAQSFGANPLAMRQMMQTRGQSSRDLAELSGIQRMQEQQAAQQMLGNQLGQQANTAMGYINQGFNIAKSPIESNIAVNQFNQQMQLQRDQMQMQKDLAAKQRQAQLASAAIGSIGSVAGMAAMSDERQKQAPGTAAKLDKKQKEAFIKSLGNITAPPEDISQGIQSAVDSMMNAWQYNKQKQAAVLSPTAAIPGGAVPMADPTGQAANPKQGMLSKIAAALSDETQKQAPTKKQKIPSAAKEVSEFLDKLEAKKYEYKDTSLPGTAEGTRYGIMAQDMEKSELGKSLVKETENGKMIDTVQGFGAVLAAQSELNKRLKKLEGKKKA